MQSEKAVNKTEVLRLIPSVNTLLQGETSQNIIGDVGAKRLTDMARVVTDSLREEIQEKISEDSFDMGRLLARESIWRSRKTSCRRLET